VLRTLHGDRLREADLRGWGWGMGVSGGSTSSIGSFVFTALKGTPVSYLVGMFVSESYDEPTRCFALARSFYG
jgi:hypothetical protein